MEPEPPQYVPIPEVVRTLQLDLAMKDRMARDQHDRIMDLEKLVHSDHTRLQKLDQSVEATADTSNQLATEYQGLQNRFEALRQTLTDIETQREKSRSESVRVKKEGARLGDECTALASAVSKAQDEKSKSEANVRKLEGALALLAAEVQGLAMVSNDLSRYQGTHDCAKLARKIERQRERVQILTNQEANARDMLLEMDREIGQLQNYQIEEALVYSDERQRYKTLKARMKSAENELESAMDVSPRLFAAQFNRSLQERPIQYEQPRFHQRDVPYRTKPSAVSRDECELRELTAKVASLESMVTRQNRDLARMAAYRPPPQTPPESHREDYRALLKCQGELEEQLRTAQGLVCDLKDERDAATQLNQKLRKQRIEKGRRVAHVQPVLIQQSPPGVEKHFTGRELRGDDIRAARRTLENIQHNQSSMNHRMGSFKGDLQTFQDERDSFFQTDLYTDG
jgi:chromosome segregation ATPase